MADSLQLLCNYNILCLSWNTIIKLQQKLHINIYDLDLGFSVFD